MFRCLLVLVVALAFVQVQAHGQEVAPAVPTAVSATPSPAPASTGCEHCDALAAAAIGETGFSGAPYQASLEGNTDTILRARKGRRIRRHERRQHGANIASDAQLRERDGFFGNRRRLRRNSGC